MLLEWLQRVTIEFDICLTAANDTTNVIWFDDRGRKVYRPTSCLSLVLSAVYRGHRVRQDHASQKRRSDPEALGKTTKEEHAGWEPLCSSESIDWFNWNNIVFCSMNFFIASLLKISKSADKIWFETPSSLNMTENETTIGEGLFSKRAHKPVTHLQPCWTGSLSPVMFQPQDKAPPCAPPL